MADKLRQNPGRKGQWAVLTLVPKVFLFAGLTTLRTFIEF